MRFLLLTSFLISFLYWEGSGQSRIDSLQGLLEEGLPDTARVEVLNWLSFFLQDSVLVQAEAYAQEARDRAMAIHYGQGILDAHLNLGLIKYKLLKLEDSRKHYQDAYTVANSQPDPRGQVLALFGLGRILEKEENFAESQTYFLKALALARHMGNDRLLARIHYHLGFLYRSEAQFDLALPYLDTALALELDLGNEYRQAETYHLLAVSEVHRGNYLKALKYCQNLQVIAEKLDDDHLQAQCYRAFGHVYDHAEEKEKALEVFQKNLIYADKSGSKIDIALAQSNVGHAYNILDSARQAIYYLNRALLTFRQEEELRGSAFVYYELGSVYTNLTKYDSAYAFLYKALDISETIGSHRLMAGALLELGRMYNQKGQFSEAIPRLLTAVEESIIASKPDYVRDAKRFLADAYQGVGNTMAANVALREYQIMADSLLNRSLYSQLVLQQAEFDFEKERVQMELAKAEEELEYKTKLRERTIMQWFSIAALVICLVVAVVIARSFKVKQDANAQLEGLYSEIQQRNHEIKQQNEEIKEQRDDLKSLVAAKDRFFSIISHDLRGPIHAFTSLSGLISHYLSEGKYDELQDLVAALDTNSRNVAQLLDNLLSWAMHKQGLIAYKPEKIALRKCVDEVFSLFQLKANEKKVHLETHIAPGILVWADHNALATILRNLVSNALKFTHTDGTIKVMAKKALPYIQITVKDTGIGIKEEQLSSLFEVDQKQVSKGTQGESGTGLGLPLVYDFVKMNLGDILVNSTLGSGTSFHILLPTRHLTPEEQQQKHQFVFEEGKSTEMINTPIEHKKTGS
ncbi:MAG TPA: hypothetical protein DCE41_34095 [Cytophagales bacterium]|nr:hypothetical protein [Cytophagales bacterium]HAA21575.1 hypothetical protein [Cytophagales bacterium]HAP59030.1 hypothetical protein [Cytophagales bacterium]